jgi:hypothetical protein
MGTPCKSQAYRLLGIRLQEVFARCGRRMVFRRLSRDSTQPPLMGRAKVGNEWEDPIVSVRYAFQDKAVIIPNKSFSGCDHRASPVRVFDARRMQPFSSARLR